MWVPTLSQYSGQKKREAVCSSEILGPTYQTTRCHKPEDYNIIEGHTPYLEGIRARKLQNERREDNCDK
jgi:hypothetical protein